MGHDPRKTKFYLELRILIHFFFIAYRIQIQKRNTKSINTKDN